MKMVYDPHTDTLTITFRKARIAESDELKPDVIFDFDEQGGVVGLEILDASRHIAEPDKVDFRKLAEQLAKR